MGHIKSALQHIRRSPYQSSAAAVISSITFFVATLFMLLAFFSSSLLSYFESQPQITVFFQDSKTEKQILDLQEKLRKNTKVESIVYISKEEALRIYQEDHKDDPLLLEMVTAEILPAGLEIRAKAVEDLDEIANVMKKETGVEDVVYQKDVVDKLVSWTKSLRAMGIILLVILVVETLLVILTIVGIRIVNKRKEITILRLIGASSWYVRLPFIFEGAIYGFIGAFVGWLLSYGILLYQMPFLSGLLEGIGKLKLPFFPAVIVWPISPALMFLVFSSVSLLGILLGVIGSFIAVHRYLR